MTTVGSALPVWRLPVVDGEKMKVLALLLADPNPIHFDPAAVMAVGLGDCPINQGPSSMAMLANAVRAAFPRGRLTRLQVTLRGSVAAGEEALVRGIVVAHEPTSRGESIRCELTLESGDRTVLRGLADVSVDEGPP
ncbi:MaoC/PaaZ C-terminal domain-containing protein [Actinomycetospora sp. CA-053990]|uniref:MaoC/PaaZ C-terminal domain-containing protein n=1 Tax=Actinomycetospora sp. CA-053990 TaxID=3239891 RepID=UPI003D8B96DD